MISVITVVYNGERTLQRCISSVMRQTYVGIEYIVIDGGSTDSTLDIIQLYESHIDYWISERDSGIYDAMNKGIARATGQYVFFLNADDELISDGILSEVANQIRNDRCRCALYYGDVRYRESRRFVSRMSRKMFFVNTVHHQGAFYSRTIFWGFTYDTQRVVSADYELNLLIYLRKLPAERIDRVIAVCDDMGVSKTTPAILVDYENHLVRMRHLGRFFSWAAFFVALLNTWRRKLWKRT